MAQLVQVSIPGGVLENLPVTQSLCPRSVFPRIFPGNFLVGRVRPAGIADTSAALFVPNVKVGVKAQDFFPPLSLHDWLWESFGRHFETLPFRKVISAAE